MIFQARQILFRDFERMNPDILTNTTTMNNVTDRLFCFIQNDHRWMRVYLHTVAHKGNLSAVNSMIAKMTRDRYDLRNNGTKVKNPQSTLIQGYHELV